jgi:hypothetical protein
MVAAIDAKPVWQRVLPYLLSAWIFYVFVWYLQYKFTGAEGSVFLFTVLTDWLGLHGHEKIMRIGTGVAELVAAILCFVPRLQVVGAALSLGIMTGAIFFHLVTPLGIDPYDDGAVLFKEAVATWCAALAILWLRRDEAIELASRLPLVGGLAERVLGGLRAR